MSMIMDEDFGLIYKIRTLYAEKTGGFRTSSVNLDNVVLSLLEHLKGETVLYMRMGSEYGRVKQGVVISVKNRKVHIREGYMKRRLDIKHLIVYHPSILAALSLV